MYLFDVHTHTSEVSPCGVFTAEETVDAYCALGYDGICITDHFNAHTLDRLGKSSWEETVEAFASGYRRAEAAGRRKGLVVLFGAEMKVSDYECNEYLVYGLTPEVLAAHPYLYDRTLAELSALVHANGGMIFQAHPFRFGMVVTNPDYVDGIEVFNGHPGHNSNNDIAEVWAEKYGKIKTSGTDHHDPEHQPRGGILTDFPITSEKQLIEVLRSGNYELIKD